MGCVELAMRGIFKNLLQGLTLTLPLIVFPAVASCADQLLSLVTKIPLGDVKGRIDHFAIDLERKRLFLAELGNDSVAIIDLKAGKVIRTITGMSEPQGVGFSASTDTLYVANGGDGSVRLFEGEALSAAGSIELGVDADNIRIDQRAGRVFIGHGNGALAVIDAKSRAKITDIPLAAHPEGFQLDMADARVFVNVPGAGQVAVIDIATGRKEAVWAIAELGANFPMAFDETSNEVITALRSPSKLFIFNASTGAVKASLDVCGDADDVLLDAKRNRLYVSCGAGVIDVFEKRKPGYERVARIPTVSGARTAFFAPELDLLFLAARAAGGALASVWVMKPN
jgi:DNA-binding beta-propeller fold protein YncE